MSFITQFMGVTESSDNSKYQNGYVKYGSQWIPSLAATALEIDNDDDIKDCKESLKEIEGGPMSGLPVEYYIEYFYSVSIDKLKGYVNDKRNIEKGSDYYTNNIGEDENVTMLIHNDGDDVIYRHKDSSVYIVMHEESKAYKCGSLQSLIALAKSCYTDAKKFIAESEKRVKEKPKEPEKKSGFGKLKHMFSNESLDIQYIEESSFDNTDCLSDIYCLERMHFDIVKDGIRYQHMTVVGESEEILMEAFSDIISKMSELFKKMIASIKEFFKKLFMYIASCFMDINKFVKKYKSNLDKVDKVEFSIYGYNFTNLDNEPDLSEFKSVVDGYNDFISDAKKYKKADIQKMQKEYLSTDNLDKLRGKLLGVDKMEEDGFADNVRKHYRDGEEDTTSIEIDTGKFRDFVNGADKLMKDKKKAEKLRDDTIIMLNKAMRFFDTKVGIVYKDKEKVLPADKLDVDMDKKTLKTNSDERQYISEGNREVFDTMVRFKYNQTRQLAGMVNIVVREYANAYKDKVKMTREVIRKALFDSNTDSSMGESEKKDED